MSSRVLSAEELEARAVSEFPYRRREGGARLVADDAVASQERAAFERGFREGQQAGLAAAEQRLEPALRRLEDALRELGTWKQRLAAEVERDVVRLALDVAAKILRKQVQVDPSVVETMIHAALDRLGQTPSARVRLHPDDYRRLMSPGETSGASRFGPGIVLVEDEKVQPGGCIVEAETGVADARMDTQLEEIARGLLDAF